jgi:heat shock protein HtpX
MVAAPPRQQVLVYNRIAKNRRKTWLLASLTIVSVIPFILGISLIVSAVVVARVGPHTRVDQSEIRWEENYLQNSPDIPPDVRAAIERKLERQRAAVKGRQGAGSGLFVELIWLVSAGLTAIMGLLFWGMVSAPTSKLLVQVGALPAGERELEARRLLENLAIGAGLPFPKLYIIETSAPNAFAAGIDPYDAVIVVTRGALNLFDKRELEAVLAHELSHIGNHDIRLNTIVAVIALFLRIPYLLFKRELRQGAGRERRRLGMWEFALSPVGVYILFIAPALAAVLRAAVSREREFLADADAVLLTRHPEGLVRALAKIAGAGSVLTKLNPVYSHFYFSNPGGDTVGWFNGSLTATHPPLAERIERVKEFQGPAAAAAVADAIKEGKDYTERRPIVEVMELFPTAPDDELRVLNQGNPLGRVYRLLDSSPAPVFDQPSRGSIVLAQVQPGALLVVFDDPGPFRQVNTAEQTFGYLERSVKLQLLKQFIPAEVYDPKLREAAQASLSPFWVVPVGAAPSVAKTPVKPANTLTGTQMFVVALFVIVVFVGTFYVLTKLG